MFRGGVESGVGDGILQQRAVLGECKVSVRTELMIVMIFLD